MNDKILQTKVSEITPLDLSVYIVLLIATTCFAMSITENNMFYFVQVMERLFLTRLSYNEYGFQLSFNDLVTVEDWWLFARNTFSESIAIVEQKNNSTFGAYICVTLPRLRQLRVRNETCNVNHSFRRLYNACYGEYSSENEDLSGFQNDTYMTANEVGATALWGTVATYRGGGYIEELSLNIQENKQTLDSLKHNNWIDRATRAVVIEFALFNANRNLFCNIKLLAEIPSTGAILSFSAISPFKYSILGNGILQYISAVFFYAIILYYSVNLIFTIIETGLTSTLGYIWTCLDFIIIVLGYVTLVYIIWHTIYLDSILKNGAIRTHRFSLDLICQWYTFFTFTLGMCVFLVWIKLLKYVNLHLVMRQFSKTLQRSAQDLLGFAIMFSIIFIAYTNLSILLFGSSQEHFRDFRNALLSTIRMVLCDFDYTQIEEEYPILAPCFFLSYILLVLFILMNMFLAILYDTYSEVKNKLKSGKLNDIKYDFMCIYERLKKMLSRSKSRPVRVYMHSHESSMKHAGNKKMRDEIEILTKCFEIHAEQRTQEELEELYKRIELLEESLSRLLVKVEYALRILETHNNSIN